jgi:putative FmdB family regulatory protein
MPIYVYECQNCKKTTQVRAKMSDSAPKLCNHCQAQDTMQKVIAPSAFQLQGGGWFAQGYSSSSGASGGSSGSSE